MNARRRFLAFIGLSPAAVVPGAVSSDVNVLHYTLHCPACKRDYPDSVDVTKVIAKATPQCPQCLYVMQMPADLSSRIFALQGRDRYGRRI